MKQILTKLITKRRYATKEIALQKIDKLFAFERLSSADYTELYNLIQATYESEE